MVSVAGVRSWCPCSGVWALVPVVLDCAVCMHVGERVQEVIKERVTSQRRLTASPASTDTRAIYAGAQTQTAKSSAIVLHPHTVHIDNLEITVCRRRVNLLSRCGRI